ncbi:MAG TPA: GNAT family N-acetyltransferase [Anaerolineales bacterium]|jgi:aminoglycoside 6'-N-acetyltransferase I
MNNFTVRRAVPGDRPGWLRMRLLLWPDHTPAELAADLDEILSRPDEQPVFIALRSDGTPAGFLEGGLRNYADGCDTAPVGYIEGWYVDEDLRRQGVGAALVSAMEAWARARGLTEMGSDTWLWNDTSIAAHTRLGYVEMERLVHFAKKL